MANLFADTGIGKHIIRTHHWGIVLPTVEKAEAGGYGRCSKCW